MITALIIFLTLFVLWKWQNRRHSTEPPMLPGAWPFIGHAHLLVRKEFWKVLQNFTKQCMELGNVSYFCVGPVKCYVLTDPDDIFILSNTCFEKDQYGHRLTKQLFGDGLVFSSVQTWKRHRKLINPTFNQQILDSFVDIFNRQGRKLIKSMEVEIGKGLVDQSKYVKQNFMETICLTVIDDSITPEEAKTFVEALESSIISTVERYQKPWLHPDCLFRFSTLKKRLEDSTQILRDISDKVLIKKREKKLNGLGKKEEKNSKFKVFMDLLMDLDNGVLTDKEIRDEMKTIIIAGHDTTASVIISTLVLIGSHPEVQEKLYLELQRIFGDTDRDIEKQDFAQLTYMDAVLKESMRVFILAPVVGRYLDREVKLKTCTLQPGNNCYFLYCGLHRHPAWGPDVNDFKPERWLDPATLPNNPNIFAAFSVGKRNCIGKTYAMMSMKASLCHLLRRYEVRADHTKMEFTFEALLKPSSGHLIAIEDRLNL